MKPLKRWLSSVIILLILTESGQAFWADLTPEQVEQAIAYGKANKDKDFLSFAKEWFVQPTDRPVEQSGPQPAPLASLQTEFATVAYMSRNAALQQINLSQAYIEKKLQSRQGLLHFVVILHGDSPNFTENHQAVLKYQDKLLEPSFKDQWTIPVTSTPPIVHRAQLVYEFPREGIDPNGSLTLVVSHPSYRKNLEFQFQLAQMR